MRRYALYLVISFLAFCVGIIFSLNYLKLNNSSEQLGKGFPQNSTQPIGNKTIIETAKSKSPNEIRFVCNDEKLKSIWLDFLKEPEISRDFLYDYQEKPIDCRERLKIKSLDLNDDGKDEYAVSLWCGLCGSKGNCPTALYWQRNGKYERLMYHSNKMFVEATNNKTFGYRDVKTFFGLGVYGMYVETYRFTGREYKRKKCFDWYPNQEKDEMTPTKCWEVEK